MLTFRGLLVLLSAASLVAWDMDGRAETPLLEPAGQTGDGPKAKPDGAQSVDLWRPGDPGQRLHVLGRVTSTDGRPIPGAELTIWQADGAGRYHEARYRAVLRTESDGGYRFSTVLPGQYYGVKHIHMLVTHRAHGQLPTRVLFKGDPYLEEAPDSALAIDVEEARVDNETVLFGRFDIVMQPRVSQ